jgi:molybdopterin-guanine dinucleotide biosynthesis protein A
MSRRFGGDKTLATLHGKPLVQWVAEGLTFATDKMIVAKEPAKYAFLNDISFVTDLYEQQCPLVGILSAFKHAKNDHLFVISADMPLFPFSLVPDMAQMMGEADIAVPVINGKYYPCAAIYHRRVVPILADNFSKGVYKLITIFNELNIKTLSEAFFTDTSGFANINTKEDLEKLIQRIDIIPT